MSDLTRPIIGIENRTAQEVFDIMCDRFRVAERALAERAGEVRVAELVDGLLDLRDLIMRGKRCVTDTGPAVKPVIELASVHILDDAANALEALTTEPAEPRACTCHPDDNPPDPCTQKFAYSECVAAAPEGQQEPVASGVSGVGWTPLTELEGVMACPMPSDETVVEVMLKTGTVCRALYSCNLMEAGDWDFVPVAANGEPEDDADSIASEVVAWRHTLQPACPTERTVTYAMVEAGAKAIVACRFEDESEPVSDYDLELSRAALKAAMEAGR